MTTKRVNLIDAFGRGATHGTLWWHGRVGNRVAFIQLLGRGEMGGVDKAYYGEGYEIPEFDGDGNRNWKFWSSDDGVETGPPALIPQLAGFRKAGLTWVEVLLPAELSEGEGEPAQMIWYLRGLKVHDYTLSGNNLVQGAKVWSANPALVALFIATQRLKLPLPRFHGPSWISDYKPHCDASLTFNGGTGLLGEYFSGTNFNTLVLSRNDAQVDFDWTDAAAHPSLTSNGYSVRLRGKVRPEFSQTYTFYARYDDAARLWVNGVQLINDWAGGAERETSGTIALTAGVEYDITLEYFQIQGPARLQLLWSSASQPKQVVPQSRLAPLPRTLPRFACHVAFPANTPAPDAFRSIFRITPGCDFQDVSGRLKVLVGPARPVTHKFTYDETQALRSPNIVNDSFSLQPRNFADRPTHYTFTYFDVDDPFFAEKTVEVTRPALLALAGGRPNPVGPVPLGLMTGSQADRIGNSEAKVTSDLAFHATLTGFADAHKLARADAAEVTHQTPGIRETAPLKVFVKSEKFLRSGADERQFTVRIHDDNYYSDTDHTPLSPALTSDLPSPYRQPPPVTSVTLVKIDRILADYTYSPTIQGSVTFAPHPYPQRGRVFWKRPGDSIFLPTNITFPADPTYLLGSFEVTNVPLGLNSFKIVTESLIGVTHGEADAVAYDINVTSIPPPLPANLTLRRGVGTAPADLFITWDRGQHPDGNIYRGEEFETYLLRIKASGILKRQVVIRAHPSEPISWTIDTPDPAGIVALADGTVSISGNASSGRALSQEIFSDAVIQFEVDDRLPPLQFGLLRGTQSQVVTVDHPTNVFTAVNHGLNPNQRLNVYSTLTVPAPLLGPPFTPEYYVIEQTENTFKLSLSPNGTPIDLTTNGTGMLTIQDGVIGALFDTSIVSGVPLIQAEIQPIGQRQPVAGDVYTIQIANNSMRYFYRWRGTETAPMYVSPQPPAPDVYRVYAVLGGLDSSPQAALRATITRSVPRQFLYTREMQLTDFAGMAVPVAVTVEVAQISSLVGVGPFATATG